MGLPTSCGPLVSLHKQVHYLIRKELKLLPQGSPVSAQAVLLQSIQLRRKGRLGTLALLRGRREATVVSYKVECWVGSWRDRVSGKLPPVSKV